MKLITMTGIAASALLGVTLASGPANAAVTVNPDGTGFVGKGDVQALLGWNDATLQKNAPTITALRLSRPVSQAVTSTAAQVATQSGTQTATQTATQTGTQTVTQTVSEELSCTYTNGSIKNTKVFHRDGERSGVRSASRTGVRTGSREATRDAARTGTRTGSRAGTQSAVESAVVEVDSRKNSSGKNGSITGFNLTKVLSSSTSLTGDPTWGAATLGDWSFGEWAPAGDFDFADYSFGSYTFDADLTMGPVHWSDWVSEPGDNPADCLRSTNADDITDLSDVVTPGEVQGGDVVDGPIVQGDVQVGDIEATGTPMADDVTYGQTTFGDTTPSGPYALTGLN